MAATPTNPSNSPTSTAPWGSLRNSMVAITAAKIGMAPLSIPATAELMYCWAIGKSVKGIATHTKESAINRGRS
jgi:hypothetical protein